MVEVEVVDMVGALAMELLGLPTEEGSVEVMEVVEAMAAVVEDIVVVVVEVDMVEVLRHAMESETPRATGKDTQRRSCAQ